MKRYLTLNEQPAKLKVLTAGTEKHGKEVVPRTALRIEYKAHNSVLAMLHPRLCTGFYAEADTNTAQEPIFETPADAALTEKIFTEIDAVKWAYEAMGCTATIHYGTRGKSNVVMEDCKVDGMEIAFLPGGTVSLAFNIKGHPSPADVSKLYELQERDITLSLTEPAQGELDAGEGE